MSKLLGLSVVSLFLVSTSAFAHGGDHGGACKGDVEKFCKDVKPGGGAIIQCLKSHEAELSAECKNKGAEFKEKMHEFMEACSADKEKLCKDVKPGGGAIIQCLKTNESALSPACKAAMEHKKDHSK